MGTDPGTSNGRELLRHNNTFMPSMKASSPCSSTCQRGRRLVMWWSNTRSTATQEQEDFSCFGRWWMKPSEKVKPNCLRERIRSWNVAVASQEKAWHTFWQRCVVYELKYYRIDPDSRISDKAWGQKLLQKASLSRRERLDCYYAAGACLQQSGDWEGSTGEMWEDSWGWEEGFPAPRAIQW